MAWYPDAQRNHASRDGGSHIDGVPWRGVIHTTESYTFTPRSDYYGHSSWPHFTVTRDGEVFQHLDTERAARAMANPSGGVQTNRCRAIQIEVVGYAREQPGGLRDSQVAAMRGLMRWLETTHGVMPEPQGLDWRGNDAYGTAAAQRMSSVEWETFPGWCGHQHVPENSHWDPGALDINVLCDGEDMPTAEEIAHEVHTFDYPSPTPENPDRTLPYFRWLKLRVRDDVLQAINSLDIEAEVRQAVESADISGAQAAEVADAVMAALRDQWTA